MSAATTTDRTDAKSPHTPTVPSLLRAELRRIRSRRFVQILLAVFVVGVLFGGFGAFHSTAKSNDAAVADAIRTAAQAKADCLANAPASQCPDDVYRADNFLSVHPARPSNLVDHSLGVGIAFAVVAFLIGATVGGAEWSQKTMPALLFWEPRRIRVLLVKALALAVTLFVLAVAAQLLWTALESLVVALHGSWADRSPDLWSLVLGGQFRVVLFGVLTGLGAFGIANLTRNTGAALGAAFVYFAVVETALHMVRPMWAPYLLSTNVGGFLAKGGLDVPTTNGEVVYNSGVPVGFVHLSNGRAGFTLALYVVLVLSAALFVFRRRDIT